MNSNKTVYVLAEGAVMVAAAIVLSFLELDLWANGGSLSLTMLPLVVFALRRGGWWGMGAGLVFGTIKCILSGALGWGWASILLDYSVAYMAVGLGGFVRRYGIAAVTLVGGVARFIVHYISGLTIYAVSVAEPGNLFGAEFVSAPLFSLVYNGSYMLVNIVAVLVVGLLLQRPMKQYLRPIRPASA